MSSMRKFCRLLTLLLSMLLVGCAAPPLKQAETYDTNRIVTMSGIEFQAAKGVQIGGGQFAAQAGSGSYFYQVDVRIKNTLNQPIPAHFAPKFRLVSSNGFYEPHSMATIQASLQKGFSALDPLNPMVSVTRPLIFLVPNGDYKLEVAVPSKIQFNPFSTTTQSDRFFFNLGRLVGF